MKKILIFGGSALCLLSGVALYAAIEPKGTCTFVEDDAIYMCTGDDCVCNAPDATCSGIKIKMMDLHPGDITL